MNKVLCHKDNFEEKIQEISEWKVSRQEQDHIKKYFDDYRRGKITNRVSENPERSFLRILDYLKVGLENLDSMSIKGVEEFQKRLLKNEIRYERANKKFDYSLRGKQDIMNNLKRYLIWRGKNLIVMPLEVKIKVPKKDFDIISKEETDLFVDSVEDIGKKFFIRTLRFGGMRAEEFYNIRDSDFIFPKENEQFVKIRLRHEFSKTEGRTISIYDKKYLKIAKQFIYLRKQEGMKPEEPVFNLAYNSMKKWLRRSSMKILGRPISHHTFRHSLATDLASEMNRQQLCIYFGWKFSSNMVDKYIQRNGVDMKLIEEKFSKTNIEELENEVEHLKGTIEIMSNSFKIDVKKLKQQILQEIGELSFVEGKLKKKSP